MHLVLTKQREQKLSKVRIGMTNEKKRILAKIANPEERGNQLSLLLSLPPENPDKRASSGTATILWVNREEEERA